MALKEPLIPSQSPGTPSANYSHAGGLGSELAKGPDGLFFSDVVVAAGGTEIVHGASGWVAPGEILALMGPSGKEGGMERQVLGCRCLDVD